MAYDQTIHLLSSAIFDLESKNDGPLKQVLSEKSRSNLSIYRKNLFGVVLKSFRQDFPVVHEYLGDHNFACLVREMILKKGISSANIAEVSTVFPDFLAECVQIHQDEILSYLALIDLNWSQVRQEAFEIPERLVEFWRSLLDHEPNQDITIDLNQMVGVQVVCQGDEKMIVRMEGR